MEDEGLRCPILNSEDAYMEIADRLQINHNNLRFSLRFGSGPRLSRLNRKCESDSRAAIDLALDRSRSAVKIHDRLHQGQPQA